MFARLYIKGRTLWNISSLVQPIRFKYANAYDAPGITTTTIINKNCSSLMVTAYSQIYFRLSNKALVIGPMILFKDSILVWNVKDDTHITAENLELFWHLWPPLEMLIIGYGGDRRAKVSDNGIPMMARNHKISLEFLPTHQAVATYNFMVEEGRRVAGAFIPPRNFELDDTDILHTREMQDLRQDRGSDSGIFGVH